MKRTYPWRRRLQRTAVAVLLVVALVAFALYWNYTHRLGTVASRIEELRAQGQAVTLEDVAAVYEAPRDTAPVIEDRNAAGVYSAAFTAERKAVSADPKLAITREEQDALLSGTADEALWAKLAAYLASREEVLGLLHQGARIEECRFPLNLEDGFSIDLSHLAQVREGMRILRWEAVWAAHEGDPERAGEALLAAFKLATATRCEPTLISQLVHIASHEIAFEALKNVINGAALSDAHLEQLAARLAATDARPSLATGLMGERAFGLQAYEDPANLLDAGGRLPVDDVLPGGTRMLINGAALVGLWQQDEARYLERMNELVEASQMPFPEALDEARAIQERIEDGMGMLPLPSRMLLPALTRCLEAQARLVAEVRMAQCAVAVERYQQAHGAPPQSLAELTPAYLPSVPNDPWDGEPIRYEPSAGGATLYSLGPDRIDHGGMAYPPNRRYGQDGDQTFALAWKSTQRGSAN